MAIEERTLAPPPIKWHNAEKLNGNVIEKLFLQWKSSSSANKIINFSGLGALKHPEREEQRRERWKSWPCAGKFNLA